MTVYTDNSRSFATTPEQRIRELRRENVEVAVDFLTTGYPHAAEQVMAECLEKQMRVAGIRPFEALPGGVE